MLSMYVTTRSLRCPTFHEQNPYTMRRSDRSGGQRRQRNSVMEPPGVQSLQRNVRVCRCTLCLNKYKYPLAIAIICQILTDHHKIWQKYSLLHLKHASFMRQFLRDQQ